MLATSTLSCCIKGQLISKGLFLSKILPKNEQKIWCKLLWYLRLNCFRPFFWKNWRYQKEISKLTDLWSNANFWWFLLCVGVSRIPNCGDFGATWYSLSCCGTSFSLTQTFYSSWPSKYCKGWRRIYTVPLYAKVRFYQKVLMSPCLKWTSTLNLMIRKKWYNIKSGFPQTGKESLSDFKIGWHPSWKMDFLSKFT